MKIIINDADSQFLVDEKKLFQILLNLLSNAAKFTHEGTITLSAAIKNQELLISVRDTGIGIDQEQQEIIFEPFRQIDGSETRQFLGTGLGLSITMHFTQLLGGEIKLESEMGKGSCFSVSIPEKPKTKEPTNDH